MLKLVVCNVVLWIFLILLIVSLATNNWLTLEWTETVNGQTMNLSSDVGLFQACFAINQHYTICLNLFATMAIEIDLKEIISDQNWTTGVHVLTFSGHILIIVAFITSYYQYGDLGILGLLCFGSLVILVSNIKGSYQLCKGTQLSSKDITGRGIMVLLAGFLVAGGIVWHHFHVYKEVESREANFTNGEVSKGWSFFLACSGGGGVILTSMALILLADSLKGRIDPQNEIV